VAHIVEGCSGAEQEGIACVEEGLGAEQEEGVALVEEGPGGDIGSLEASMAGPEAEGETGGECAEVPCVEAGEATCWAFPCGVGGGQCSGGAGQWREGGGEWRASAGRGTEE